jgi:prepilin-type N-terminal cleavage/methylation domain-containing protein
MLLPETQTGAGGRRRRWALALRRSVRVRLGGQRGVSMIELLLVILLASVVSTAVLMVLQGTTKVFNSQEVRMLNQDDARTAINQMARYIRMATSSEDNQITLSNAIATAEAQNIEFYCDVDGDFKAEKTRYYVDGSVLMSQTMQPRWIAGTTTPSTTQPRWVYDAYDNTGVVIENRVRNGAEPMFTYYRYVDEHGTLEVFAPSTELLRREIVTIGITIKVGERPDLAAKDVVLSTDVQIRQRYQGGLK